MVIGWWSGGERVWNGGVAVLIRRKQGGEMLVNGGEKVRNG
mgnify:CR=1 FL=1